MPITVTQINFDPTLWAAGGGAGTAPGDNGFDAFPVFMDQDGVTAWAFEYFADGWARFNLSDGSIVQQDALFGTPAFFNSIYTHEDGSGTFLQDDQGHYYTFVNQTTIYKSHVGAGIAGNLFNGYMIDDATLDIHTGSPLGTTFPIIEGTNNPIAPASDGNRYIVLTQSQGSPKFAAINVGTMSIVGTYPITNRVGGNPFMDSNGDFWSFTGIPGNSTVTASQVVGNQLTITFSTAHSFQSGDAVLFDLFTEPELHFQSMVLTGTTMFTITGPFTHANYVNPTESGFVTNESIILIKWHPADGATLGVLNVTTHRIQASVTGLITAPNFSNYIPSTNSVLLGTDNQWSGDLVSLNLTTLTQNAIHLDDFTFFGLGDGAFDLPACLFVQGVGGILNSELALAGDVLNPAHTIWSGTQTGGILNLVDPAALTLTQTFDITSLINASAPLTPTPSDRAGNRRFGYINQTQESAGSVVTFTGPNNFIAGDIFSPQNLTVATWLGGNLTVLTATGTSWTANDPTLHGTSPLSNEGYPPGNRAIAQGSHSAIAMQALTPAANMVWNSAARKLVLTYQYIGSPVYLLSGFALPSPPALNGSSALLVSSEAPSSFEDTVTFTATVSDPIVGDPNPNTAPIGTVNFVADGTFGFGSATLAPLTATISMVQASATVATYTASNSFSSGQKVTITGFHAGFVQFNQTNVTIATASPSSFTVNGTYTVQAQVTQNGTATSTSASQASAFTGVLIPGLHTIVAHYLGDPTPVTGHTATNSNTVTQQVVNVSTNNTVELPGFALIGNFSVLGDSALPPQAQLSAIPTTATPHQSINLLWNTLNVAFVRITGNNGTDYQPAGFDTGFISTSGSGIYVVGSGFTATITLTLQAYDLTHTAIPGLVSQVLIHIA
jgi:hypothetical protein